MKVWNVLLSGALALAVAMPAMAQNDAARGKKAASQTGYMNDKGGAVTTSEQQMVLNAAQGDRAEVELGNLALQKSQNEQIKQFAQRMVDDHGKNEQQVKSLAKDLNVTVPNDLSAEQQRDKQRLEGLSGEQFDHAYAQLMLRDHRKDVAEFRHAQQTAQNSELKQYLDQTLPVLEQHLQMAEKLSAGKR